MKDKFYCNNCEKDVTLVNGVCPSCGTNWDYEKEDLKEKTNSSKLVKNQNKKIKVFQLEEFKKKLGLGCIFPPFVVAIILSMELSNVLSDIMLILAFLLFVGYVIYLYFIYNKYVCIDDINSTDIIMWPNIKDSPNTEAVKSIISKFDKMNWIDKYNCWNDLPTLLKRIKIYQKQDSEYFNWRKMLKDFCKFMEENNLHYAEEIDYLFTAMRNEIISYKYMHEALKDIKSDIENEMHKNNCSEDIITTNLLSCSNKVLDMKKEYKLTIDDNYLYILDKNFIEIAKLRSKIENFERMKKTDNSDFISIISSYKEKEYVLNSYIIEKIRISDILFFTTNGSEEIRTIVSGGGTSGYVDEFRAQRFRKRITNSDNSPLLSGDMAAMYSMLDNIKIDPITTEFIKDDRRVVIIKTYNMDLVFSQIGGYYDKSDLYLWLVDKLPDKDLQRMNFIKNDNSPTDGNLDEIKKLKELLDIGAITQEEFDTKKKELLE